MKTNTTIYNHYAGGFDINNSYPTSIICDITMSQEEVVETLGVEAAKKLSINVSKFISLDDDLDEEDYDDKTICSIELDLYPNAEEADLHSIDGAILYECAMKAFGEKDDESVIVNLVTDKVNKTMRSPGVLLTVLPHGDLDEDDLNCIYMEIIEQISLSFKMAKLLMNSCFKNKANAFVGIPCTSHVNLELAQLLYKEGDPEINSITEGVFNITKLSNCCW